jgi:predicted ATPase
MIAPGDLQVHIGIHTGVALVGEMGTKSLHESGGVLGAVPNLAARLESDAGPGQILISQETADLVKEHFMLAARPNRHLKGFNRSLATFEVQARRDPDAAGLADRQRLPHPVGRAKELTLLKRLEARSRKGEGQLACLRGEPGIGKSLLARTLLAVSENRGVGASERIVIACAVHARHSAFHPFTACLRRLLGIESVRAPEDLSGRLTDLLGDAEAARRHLTAAALLVCPDDTAPDIPPAQARRRIIAFLLDWLTSVPEGRHRILLIEDLHWADESTREVLGLLSAQIAAAPILMLVTQRGDCGSWWKSGTRIHWIDLGPLSRRSARKMIRALTSDARLAETAMTDVLAKVGGNPLYIEEFVKSMTAGATGTPVSLSDSLMARLDRLGAAKGVLQAETF